MHDKTLQRTLIRLAHEKPELRPHLLPMLKRAYPTKAYISGDPKRGAGGVSYGRMMVWMPFAAQGDGGEISTNIKQVQLTLNEIRRKITLPHGGYESGLSAWGWWPDSATDVQFRTEKNEMIGFFLFSARSHPENYPRPPEKWPLREWFAGLSWKPFPFRVV